MTVRTRFAPSPTGFLHIGGLRTCLYNYLYAKKHSGVFILRIEDTDQERFVEGAAESLLRTLDMMHLNPDEGPMLPAEAKKAAAGDKTLTYLEQKGDKGPYIQSQRTEIYLKYARELIEKGAAYYAFETSEELDQMRKEQEAAKLPPMYDRRALRLTPDEVNTNLKAGLPYVIRLKMPREKEIVLNDRIYGRIKFQGNQIDDQILIKSDGLPTYHLANVVDDHLMEITHVIRGEEWLPSTPKHLIMYEAFGWTPPEFAHVPLILNADKSKLSKRQNDVSVESYLEKGYHREALINFIAMLGWNPGKGSTQEIFDMNELTAQFSLEGIHKSGAVFNPEKLDWLNQQWEKIKFYTKLDDAAMRLETNVEIRIHKNQDHTYIFENPEKALEFAENRAEHLLDLAKDLKDQPAAKEKPESFRRAILVNEEKILQNPKETWSQLKYFFSPAPLNKSLLENPKMGVDTPEKANNSLQFCQTIIKEIPENATLEDIKNTFIEKIKEANRKNGEVLWPLRVCLTHEEFSVGAFESVWVLGKEESLKRLAEILV